MNGQLGIVGLAVMTIYILVKEVIAPLVRRLNGKHAGNPNGLLAELREFKAQTQARYEAQKETNRRLEGNISRIFERLDELAQRKTL